MRPPWGVLGNCLIICNCLVMCVQEGCIAVKCTSSKMSVTTKTTIRNMINNASFQSTSTLALPQYMPQENNVSLYFGSILAESAVGEADD